MKIDAFFAQRALNLAIQKHIDSMIYGQPFMTTFWVDDEPTTAACNHTYVEMGFMHSKMVCKHCDAEKK